MTKSIFGKLNILRNIKYEMLGLLNKKNTNFQKKNIETLESLVITLADFEDLIGQSRSENIKLDKKG